MIRVNIVRVASSIAGYSSSSSSYFNPSSWQNFSALVQSFSAKLSYQTMVTSSYGMSSHPSGKLLFHQLFEKESSPYTYLLADLTHPLKPALLIYPVDKMVERDLSLVKELGLKLIYAMNIHVHADHVTGTGTGKIKVPGVRSVISKASKSKADLLIEAVDKIHFGDLFLEVRATPSHTLSCVTYVTGDSPISPNQEWLSLGMPY